MSLVFSNSNISKTSMSEVIQKKQWKPWYFQTHQDYIEIHHTHQPWTILTFFLASTKKLKPFSLFFGGEVVPNPSHHVTCDGFRLLPPSLGKVRVQLSKVAKTKEVDDKRRQWPSLEKILIGQVFLGWLVLLDFW